MASRAAISGVSLGLMTTGLVLAWSGVENVPVGKTLQDILTGKLKAPPQAPGSLATVEQADLASTGSTAAPGTGGGGGAINAAPAAAGKFTSNQALARIMAAQYGWSTGQAWTNLNYGWGTLESGWNPEARNGGSGAFGIAQALGHGTAATAAADGTNEYGPNNGISAATAKAANGGAAWAQIAWGLAYIKATYGSPARIPGWTPGASGGYVGY